MSDKSKLAPGTERIRVTVPSDVARYFEAQSKRYAVSVSACAGPLLCAAARGEIQQTFTQARGADLRPK